MKLFDISFPQKGINADELYFGIQKGNWDYSMDRIPSGTVFHTFTYYNMFSLSKYQTYTSITNLKLNIRVRGNVCISVFRQSIDSSVPHNICMKEITQNDMKEVIINIVDLCPQKSDAIYFSFEARSEDCQFGGGYYSADCVEQAVKVGMVICTYRREECVRRNLQAIIEHIFHDSSSVIRDDLEIFVVDNGRTLDDWKEPRIHLISNRNLGGSGGFTRGIMEICRSKTPFTHILLTDDDIILDWNVLTKTIQFLKSRKIACTDIALAGSMIYEDQPFVQHEAGAIWKSASYQAVPVKHQLTLMGDQALLENEREEQIDYAGWGYLCFPVSYVEKNQYPLPLFMKWDDVEYAIRGNLSIITMNGIGFWHPSYQNNFSASLEYYAIRNALIIHACNGGKNSFRALHFGKRYLFCAIYKKNHIIDGITRSVEDYLKGIDYLMTLDAEKNHRLVQQLFKCEVCPSGQTISQKLRKAIGASVSLRFWKNMFRFVKICVLFALKHKKIDAEYMNRCEMVVSDDFWQKIFMEVQNEEV